MKYSETPSASSLPQFASARFPINLEPHNAKLFHKISRMPDQVYPLNITIMVPIHRAKRQWGIPRIPGSLQQNWADSLKDSAAHAKVQR
jgi:hypothetical protein